jgi:hypothetical protein
LVPTSPARPTNATALPEEPLGHKHPPADGAHTSKKKAIRKRGIDKLRDTIDAVLLAYEGMGWPHPSETDPELLLCSAHQVYVSEGLASGAADAERDARIRDSVKYVLRTSTSPHRGSSRGHFHQQDLETIEGWLPRYIPIESLTAFEKDLGENRRGRSITATSQSCWRLTPINGSRPVPAPSRGCRACSSTGGAASPTVTPLAGSGSSCRRRGSWKSDVRISSAVRPVGDAARDGIPRRMPRNCCRPSSGRHRDGAGLLLRTRQPMNHTNPVYSFPPVYVVR